VPTRKDNVSSISIPKVRSIVWSHGGLVASRPSIKMTDLVSILNVANFSLASVTEDFKCHESHSRLSSAREIPEVKPETILLFTLIYKAI